MSRPFLCRSLACKKGVEERKFVGIGHRLPGLDFFAASEATLAMTRDLVEPAYVRARRPNGLELPRAVDGERQFER